MKTEIIRAVVSPHYTDRSKSGWLIRGENQEPYEAQTYKVVVAIGVSFGDSNAYERGFGCEIVAFCEEAKGFDDEQVFDKTKLHQLQFYYSFFGTTTNDDETVYKVHEVEMLYLDENGAMWAKINFPEKKSWVEKACNFFRLFLREKV